MRIAKIKTTPKPTHNPSAVDMHPRCALLSTGPKRYFTYKSMNNQKAKGT